MSLPLPKLSRRKRGWVSGDPPVSAGKSSSQRKSARDGGLTPSEQHQKNRLMKQFMRNPEGGGTGNSEAYINSPVWCACGRGMNRRGRRGDTVPCSRCRPDLKAAS